MSIQERLSAFQNMEDFLEFQAQLLDEQLALLVVQLRRLSGQLLACAANRETLLVQQAANLADHHDVVELVIATVTTTLDGLEL